MKIALMDGGSVNMGDLSWEGLKKYGEVVEYEEIIAHSDPTPMIGDCDVVIGSKLMIDGKVMDACPNLKFINVPATGYQCVDMEAARARGIAVANVPRYSTDAVAQHIFALLLSISNKILVHNEAVKNMEWCQAPAFCYLKSPLMELGGKTFCVYGYGEIGKRALKLAQAFGMKTLAVAHDPNKEAPMEGVTFVDKETAFKTADILAMTCPLTADTHKLVNAQTLALMKPTAILINTARGQLIDEEALVEALENEKIAAFGADCVYTEPMLPDCKLPFAKNAVVTSHNAWAAKETRARMIEIVCDNMEAWLKGERLNRVD